MRISDWSSDVCSSDRASAWHKQSNTHPHNRVDHFWRSASLSWEVCNDIYYEEIANLSSPSLTLLRLGYMGAVAELVELLRAQYKRAANCGELVQVRNNLHATQIQASSFLGGKPCAIWSQMVGQIGRAHV